MCSAVERNNPTMATLSPRCVATNRSKIAAISVIVTTISRSEHRIRCIDRVRIKFCREKKSRQMRGIKKNANAKTLILTISPTHMQQTTPPLALICFVSVSLPLLSFVDWSMVDRWCTNKKMNFVRRGGWKKRERKQKTSGNEKREAKNFSWDSFWQNAENF